MKKTGCLLLILTLVACQGSQTATADEGWIQLFNGRDLSDWIPKVRGYPTGENFANTFRVEDGKMKVVYDSVAYADFQERFGHIFFKEKYSWYILGVEYRFVGEQAAGGPGWAVRNSGAMLHSQNPATMLDNQDFPISIEVQFLGGNGRDERTTANLCTPGTHVMMDEKLVTAHCVSSTSKTYHGDQWVRVDVLVLGDSLMEHFVEGQSVLRYEKPQMGGGVVTDFDPSVKKDGMLLSEGYIALQSESHPIEFRKVELFNLSAYKDKPEDIKRILEETLKRKEQ